MIEILKGTIEGRIISFLRKKYPITVRELSGFLNLSEKRTLRYLHKLQVKGILFLEPLSDKTYVRLLRNDFKFISKKRQRKFIKHKKQKKHQKDEYEGIMYQ